ncbi:MAG: LysR family transcriptional regulator [Clostridiales bacterium]|nr:LysR family transcriptional regulator [Clostridiales bacterium]
MMNFLNLKYFLAIAESGSLSDAARKLYVSQQSLSEHLKKLEVHFGVPLVSREKTLVLTPAGKILANAAKQVIGTMNTAEAEISRYKVFSGRELSIGTTMGGTPPFLYDLISIFSQKSPDTEIMIRELNLQDELINEIPANIDLLVGVLPFGEKVDYTVLLSDEIAVVVSERLLESSLGPSWEEAWELLRVTGELSVMKPVPFFVSVDTNSYHVNGILEEAGIPIKTNLATDSFDLISGMCRNGSYAGLFPMDFAIREFRGDNLLMCPLRQSKARQELAIAYRRNQELSEAARMFLELAQDMFKQHRHIEDEA